MSQSSASENLQKNVRKHIFEHIEEHKNLASATIRKYVASRVLRACREGR